MSTLAKLKLITARRNQARSPEVVRRHKLVARIAEQLDIISARREGRPYSATHMRKAIGASGERVTVEQPKRVREWFWRTDSGRYCVSIRYGARVLELAKGKNAVDVADLAELAQVLGTVRDAVMAGELDAAILAASDTLRAGFGK